MLTHSLPPSFTQNTLKLCKIFSINIKLQKKISLKVSQTSAWITPLADHLGLDLVNSFQQPRKSFSSAMENRHHLVTKSFTVLELLTYSTSVTSTSWRKQKNSATIWLLVFTQIPWWTAIRVAIIQLWTYTSVCWAFWLARWVKKFQKIFPWFLNFSIF